MSVRLYVGNLPKEPVDRQALHDIFADIEGTISTKVIKDRKTGKCRGFAFVTVQSDEAADALIEKHNGQSFMENPLKIEKALPRNKNKSDSESDKEVAENTPKENKNTSPAPSKRGSSGKSKRNNSPSGGGDSVQPDPRWAAELSKLKEMLAQTTNS